MLKFVSICILSITAPLYLQSDNVKEQKEIFQFSSLDWAPYIGPDLPNQGYVVDLVKKIYQSTGNEAKINFYPWARSLHLARTGTVHGILPEYYSEERKSHFVFSDPFPGGPLVLLKLRHNPNKPKNIKELKKFKVGVVRGYVNTKEIDETSFPTKMQVENDWSLIVALFKSRIDFAVIDLNVAKYLIKTKKPKWLKHISYVDPVLESKFLYIAFSKKNKNHKKSLELFNKGLKKLKKTGELDDLLDKYGIE